MAQDGALAAFAQDFQIWKNKRPALQIMATAAERSFRLGRIWYQQFYNPIEEAASYHDKVAGKHHLKGLEKPGEMAKSLEE